jgi:hypothetical protein
MFVEVTLRNIPALNHCPFSVLWLIFKKSELILYGSIEKLEKLKSSMRSQEVSIAE